MYYPVVLFPPFLFPLNPFVPLSFASPSQVLKPRAALLSNYEVLTHFRTLHSENTSIASAISSERARRDAQKADFDRYGFDKDGKVDLKGKGREKAGMDVDVEAPVLELKTPEEEAREKEMAFRGLADELVFTTEQVSDRP